jgi:ribosome biogenesis GTPase
VGKSSILNALEPECGVPVGEVSEKLGRGRHTTRHVELYPIGADTLVADTPGFSSFDAEDMEQIPKEQLQFAFREFAPYLDRCRYTGCSHVREKGCAVLEALSDGKIEPPSELYPTL